jgi:methylthioribose-1-phosphate isomerase
MLVNDKYYRTIWLNKDDISLSIIDQRWLPHKFVIEKLHSFNELIIAIKEMHLRGAGLIGAAAGYGMYLAILESAKQGNFQVHFNHLVKVLNSTRPTAVNLQYAIKRQLSALNLCNEIEEKILVSKQVALEIVNEDAENSKKIGQYGLTIIENLSKSRKTVNILTHCNAGWLAFVDYGTALSPVYAAFEKNINIHVWVDETRPRNQGSNLTAWELEMMGIPYTIIADNTGGHLMQHEQVDMVIVGCDRATANGDVANKIGTYLKALAAKDNNVPFYVALPVSSFDFAINDGLKEIPIEQRGDDEIKYTRGLNHNLIFDQVLTTPINAKTCNYGFDVTPARLITGLITEKGIIKPDKNEIIKLKMR